MANYASQIRHLNSKLCVVQNKLQEHIDNSTDVNIGQYIKDITSLQVVGGDLVLSFIDQDDTVRTLSVTLPTTSAGSFVPSIVVDDYNELLTVTGQSLFEFAEVRNAQGTPWLPGSLGGTYRAAGLYYWNGTDWIHDNDAIFQALQQITDVNTNQQTQIDNLVFGSEMNIFQSAPVSGNTSTTPSQKINGTTGVLPAGTYTIRVDYSWNSNSTQQDFEAYLLVDGNSLTVFPSGLIQKQEPKDAAGNSNGTLSNQSYSFSREFVLTVAAPATVNAVLSFASSSAGVRTSMWDATIKIYRIQ